MTRRPPPNPAASPRVVRLAPVLGHCHLFRALPKGADGPVCDEELKYAGKHLRIQAQRALGAPEQTLLLALLELGTEQCRRNPRQCQLGGSDSGEVASQLWAALQPESTTALSQSAPALMLSTSWSELQRRCGGTHLGGTVLAARRRALIRLANVVVYERAQAGAPAQSCHLLGFWVDGDARVHVALHHRLATALQQPGYAQVSLTERQQLRSQAAMLTYVFLCCALAPGRTMCIKYETLAHRLWPGAGADVAPSTRRRHLSDARLALEAIARLVGWRVTLDAAVARVIRRRAASATSPASQSQGTKSTAKRLTMAPSAARDMTQPSYFVVPDTSYAERSLLARLSAEAHSPQYDEGGKNL